MQEIKRDENDKLVDVIVNGVALSSGKKPITSGKSFLNALKKAMETSYWNCEEEAYEGTRYVNGVMWGGCEMTALEASMYVWIVRWYARYECDMMNPKVWGAPVAVYDNMRYLLMALNPETFDLLD